MRLPVLRLFLASLLISAIAQKIWIFRAPPTDIREAVVRLVMGYGWSAYAAARNPDEPLTGSMITYQAAECDEEGRIFLVDLGLQDTPMLNHIIGPNYTRRFVYLGRVWLVQDRLEMRLEWVKQKTLSLLGMGQYMVNEVALVIAEHRDCRSADAVDWSALWRRV